MKPPQYRARLKQIKQKSTVQDNIFLLLDYPTIVRFLPLARTSSYLQKTSLYPFL